MRKARAAAIAGLACLAGLAPATAAVGAPLGSRQLHQGMSGSDVRALQRALTRAGFATTRDGVFGRQTRASVERFERTTHRRVDGAVSRSDTRALRRLAARSTKETFGGAVAGPSPRAGRATLMPAGLAQPPVSAPPEVAAAIRAANAIARKPYRYGGGHASWNARGYDCSGSVSFALHGGGLLRSPLASTGLMGFGKRGPGRWITTYANHGHAYMVVAGLRFDTSARRRTGSRWTTLTRSARGYVKRHPAGL